MIDFSFLMNYPFGLSISPITRTLCVIDEYNQIHALNVCFYLQSVYLTEWHDRNILLHVVAKKPPVQIFYMKNVLSLLWNGKKRKKKRKKKKKL